MADLYLQDDGKTLQNKLGIRGDPATLAGKEAVHVNSRLMELRESGLPQVQGFPLVKAIHRHLFQDVYEWAGKPREINLARAIYAEGRSDAVQFTSAQRIDAEGQRLFEDLTAANYLRGLTREQFAKGLSPFFGRLNTLHPFREGNGRTQRLVWEHVAKEAGHELSFEGISRERMTVVSIAASTGDHEPVRRMLAELLDPARSQALRTATRFLEANRTPEIDWQDRYVATTEPGQEYRGIFVGAGGEHFLMHDRKNIYVGNLADLPDRGRGFDSGDAVAFHAGPARLQALTAPSSASSITESAGLTATERLRRNVDRRTEELAAERERERPAREAALERERADERKRGLERKKQRTQTQKKDHGLEP